MTKIFKYHFFIRFGYLLGSLIAFPVAYNFLDTTDFFDILANIGIIALSLLSMIFFIKSQSIIILTEHKIVYKLFFFKKELLYSDITQLFKDEITEHLYVIGSEDNLSIAEDINNYKELHQELKEITKNTLANKDHAELSSNNRKLELPMISKILLYYKRFLILTFLLAGVILIAELFFDLFRTAYKEIF